MSVRAIQARIECNREELQHLWRTHRVFNERLPTILSILFKMRRGEAGSTSERKTLYKQIGQFIIASDSKNAEYLLNSVSTKGTGSGWAPGTAKKQKIKTLDANGKQAEVLGATWADDAANLSAQGDLFYDKEQILGDLPGTLKQTVCRECVAIISGHDELVHIWNKEHAEWLDKKKNWESDPEHGKYLAVRHRFDAFEKEAGGKAGKRRGRWHLYLDWLRKNPDLAAWRGGQSSIGEPDASAKLRIQKAKPWKQRSVEAEEFWKVNPELSALNKLHGFYEREFIRRRKTKKHSDGFDHRPTFTLPHAVNHPRWFVFNAPQTSPKGYCELKLPGAPGAEGSLELLLLTGEKEMGVYPKKWTSLVFKADPRLSDFKPVTVKKNANKGKVKGQETEKPAYSFYDRQLKQHRAAQISGVKLIFKQVKLNEDGTLKSAVPYLYFTCSVVDIAITQKAQDIEWSETGETTKTGKARKRKTIPNGLIACAVDLGLRNLGFATLGVLESGEVRVLRSRNLWIGVAEPSGAHAGRWAEGPDLAHIGAHKRNIKRLRRQRGKPVEGERSHVELQEHIDHMGEDRFKKSARAIINFALNVDQTIDKKTGKPFPRADVLVMEKLEGFIPDAEKERGINRALVSWNRGQLIERLKQLAEDSGFKKRLFEIHPAGTSQVCSRCGALGRRYSIARDETGQPEIRFGWVEKLFACPNSKCGYRANADHNASVNLQRSFFLDGQAVQAFYDWKGKPEPERKTFFAAMDGKLQPALRVEHKLDGPTPF